MTTGIRIGDGAQDKCHRLCPHQSLGLWPRDGSSPNHGDVFFWEEEFEIEPLLPLVLLGTLFLTFISHQAH